ncbi:MAG: PEP/pyruvate-binding domain-containing protein [Elusimicrobiaceae bacterium]|nr:PEP/pyruvate-binding domain-containing protein [Elusimicrobiaceae bacterium]
MNHSSLFDNEVSSGGFDSLMIHRVLKILLVSSPYDSSVIAEDSRLTEIIFSEYLDLSLRWSPRVVRVTTAAEALEKLRGESFDMVLTMLRVGGMDVMSFATAAKAIRPELPVVLLGYSLIDIDGIPNDSNSPVDYIFLWNGDAKILIAIIKLIEDRRNVDHDIEVAGVQVVLLVEDSVRFYSAYLPLVYTEIMAQTQKLMSEGVNTMHKLMRMRARPKILFANTYEEALALYNKYRSNILGIISDVQFPLGGQPDPAAGLKFTAMAKADRADVPVLLQSSDGGMAEKARMLEAAFLNKNSPDMLEELRHFIKNNFGFGDFVFSLPDRTYLARVGDMHSLLDALKTVPEESVIYHASHNHFSKWLMARTEFELAHQIRPARVQDFPSPAELRRYLVQTIGNFLVKSKKGVIVDFSPEYYSGSVPFAKVGTGSLGGKARGLAFFNSLMRKHDFSDSIPGVHMSVPKTVVIATDMFDAFMADNGFDRLVRDTQDDARLREAFVRAELPEKVRGALKVIVERVGRPLVVRSSSVMEDSQTYPFAGIYETYMLPNSNPDPNTRYEQLSRAVKLVYASTYSMAARNYLGRTSHLLDEEKMAVVIQQISGHRYEDVYYPSFSGVAQSHNFYPLPPVKPEDGNVNVAVGLGITVVDGRQSLRFSPKHPARIFQFANTKAYFSHSQQQILALDMTGKGARNPESGENIVTLSLADAERHGTLAPVASTYSSDNDRFYEGMSRPGPRVITFAPVLESGTFPLVEVINFLLPLGKEAMGCDVEMEFAVELETGIFHILQIRPMTGMDRNERVQLDDFEADRVICRSPKSLGHGYIKDLRDAVYVRPQAFDSATTKTIAVQIARLNDELRHQGRLYALLGPGRWGSSDSWLGVPVHWSQISSARLILETSLPGFLVDPSYGSHFLHNVIALGVGYFILDYHDNPVDWSWLDSLPAEHETELIRHVRLASPLDIRINSKTGEGVMLKPAAVAESCQSV